RNQNLAGSVARLKWLLVDRLLDAIQKRLPQLGERELRLDAAHIDSSDRLLNAARDRHFGKRDDATLLAFVGSPPLVLLLRERRRPEQQQRGKGDRTSEPSHALVFHDHPPVLAPPAASLAAPASGAALAAEGAGAAGCAVCTAAFSSPSLTLAR